MKFYTLQNYFIFRLSSDFWEFAEENFLLCVLLSYPFLAGGLSAPKVRIPTFDDDDDSEGHGFNSSVCIVFTFTLCTQCST